MKAYENNTNSLEKLREILDLQKNLIETQEQSLRLILENIESSRVEEKLEKVDLIKNTDLLSIGEFAQSLKLRGVQFGRNKLHSWLNNRGYTYRKNNKNYAMKRYIDEDLFKVKTYIVNTIDGPIETETIYLTSIGCSYFMKKILEEFNIREN